MESAIETVEELTRDVERLGLSLKPLQRKYADILLTGTVDQTTAYVDAGFLETSNVHSGASKLKRNPKVVAYMEAQVRLAMYRTQERLGNALTDRVSTGLEILDRCMGADLFRDAEGELVKMDHDGAEVAVKGDFNTRGALGANDQLNRLGGHYKDKTIVEAASHEDEVMQMLREEQEKKDKEKPAEEVN